MAKTTVAATTEPTVADLEAQISALKKQRIKERQKIIEVATRMAKNHNLCSVVDDALKEAGLYGPVKKIQVNATVDLAVVVAVDQETWDNLSEEEQKSLLGEAKIDTITWNPGGATAIRGVALGNQTLAAQPVIVKKDIVIDGVSEPPARVETPFDGQWLFTSSEGRVRHAVRMQTNGPRLVNSRAVCGAEPGFYRNSTWVHHSSRDEGRRCANCEKRLG